jgi:hypothetical protein
MLNQRELSSAAALTCAGLGLGGLLHLIRTASAFGPDADFAAKVLAWTTILSGLAAAAFLIREYFTVSIRLREPNDAERASHRAEVKILLWVYGLFVSGILMAVTDTAARLLAEPTPFMQDARKATILLFVVGLIGTLPVLRRLSVNLLHPVRKSKKYSCLATLFLAAFCVGGVVDANLPPSAAGTVGEALSRGVTFAQLLFCVLGLIFTALSLWQMKKERAELRTLLSKD